LERKEAVALLKELVDSNLAQPSIVSIDKNKRGRFNLVIKANCQMIRQFIAEKKLAIKEEKGYCIISKP
jgi:hypothetical protein